MSSVWLDAREWGRIQEVMPIVCVDAMPVRLSTPPRVGLILRETPHQGQRWCLLGGRLRRGEALTDALAREWKDAFGLNYPTAPPPVPVVVEYRPDAVPGRPHDPRQHAVSMTYPIVTQQDLHASGGEALAFRWFEIGELSADVMGFGQETIVARLLASAGVEGAGQEDGRDGRR